MLKTANKPIIAVDIDEVLFPLVPDLIKYVDKAHKVKLAQSDFVKYNLEEIWEGDPAEAIQIFEKYKKQVSIEVAPIAGATEALGELAKSYEIIVMTSRDSTVEKVTHDWLNTHFPEIFTQVHLLGNRKDSVSWQRKSEVCKELGVGYLIDDHLYNIIETSEVGISTLLFGDYPWNQIANLPAGVTRVRDWSEVLEYFDGRG